MPTQRPMSFYVRGQGNLIMSRKVQPIEVLSDQSKEVFKVVNAEPDLACVLILSSYLDQCIASLLKQYFISNSSIVDRLLNPHGTLGTYQSRADLSYVLGLIPKTMYQNASTIGDIRNDFAHSHLELNFISDEIVGKINKIKPPRIKFYISTSGDKKEEVTLDEIIKFDGNPRLKFNIISIMTADRILLSGLSTEHRERETQGW